MSMNKTVNLKRPAVILLAVIMFMAVFVAIYGKDHCNVYATGETGQVATDVLNVRAGAGTNYKILGTLKNGKTFVVTGTAKDSKGVKWYKFNYNSKTGYVSSQYVNIKQNTVTSVTGMKGTVTSSDGVNVRSGPGTKYGRIGGLEKGKTFTIKGKAQDISGVWWYTFSYNGKTGYVSSQYVSTKTTSSGVTSVKDTTGTVKPSDGVNVRSGPGTSYSRIGGLNKGKTFKVTGKAQDKSGAWWYTFSYNGKTGYVAAQYITTKTSSGTTETAPAPDKQSVGTVNTSDGVNVRSGPGTKYGRIGGLANKKTFDILGTAKDSSGVTWYKLTYNGTLGYVSSKYVKVSAKTQSNSGGSSSGTTATPSESKPVTFQMGTVTASDGLNVRSGAGTNYSRLDTLPKGTSVIVTGSAKDSNKKVWYKYQYMSSKVGYLCSDYLSVKTVTSSSEFEAYLTVQGFPDSYKPGLRALHAAHPQWQFKAVKVGYNWSDALAKEKKKNYVHPSSPKSYRSTESWSYNSSTKKYATFDSGWYGASQTVIAYYMDPRNFFNESGIYQFMTHKYDASSQNTNTVAAVIKGSFMQGKNPGGGYSSYQQLLCDAGKNSGVNPNVLAAMIIQEQGWSGSTLCSGKNGVYNFFNIGAYAGDGMSTIERGLWYAKNQGWTTPYKSVLGGAKFYANNYVSCKQDSYYTKKFNVKNGLSNVGTHQYMTNVAGAASEGSILKSAYSSNSNYPAVFEIPVYNNMPSSACRLP